jgi:hypothetical protein
MITMPGEFSKERPAATGSRASRRAGTGACPRQSPCRSHPETSHASGTGRTGTRRAYTNPCLGSGRKTAGPTSQYARYSRSSTRFSRMSEPPVPAPDLENAFRQVAPAAQQLPVSRVQIWPAGQELVQHGLAVRWKVLKRQPVDDVDRRRGDTRPQSARPCAVPSGAVCPLTSASQNHRQMQASTVVCFVSGRQRQAK